MLDLYNTLKLVEDEIIAMKKRQEPIIASYQQQIREDLIKKFMEAERSLLTIAQVKINELNIEKGLIYILLKSNRKEVSIAVRRINDERSLKVEIDPIIYPTSFNLRFIIEEPSVTLYSLTMEKGILSLNSNTVVRGTDSIEIIDLDTMNSLIDLWLLPSREGIKEKVKRIIKKLGSDEFLIEVLLALSKDPQPRRLIYLCHDHASKGHHIHEDLIDKESVHMVIKDHLKLET